MRNRRAATRPGLRGGVAVRHAAARTQLPVAANQAPAGATPEATNTMGAIHGSGSFTLALMLAFPLMLARNGPVATSELDPGGARSPPGQRGPGVAAVGLGGPDLVDPGAFGGFEELLGSGRRAGRPVTCGDGDPHLGIIPGLVG